jgi:hypothetical protein
MREGYRHNVGSHRLRSEGGAGTERSEEQAQKSEGGTCTGVGGGTVSEAREVQVYIREET